jgi:hypothetical protein
MTAVNEVLLQFLPCLFFTIIAIFAFETFLSARWSRFYFTSGIPLYRRTIMVRTGFRQVPTAEEVENALPDTTWFAPLLVHRFNDTTFAFREKMLHLRIGAYTPIMHGCLICNPYTAQVEVTGYANWSTIVLLAYFLLFFTAFPPSFCDVIIPLFFVGGILSSIYWMQRKRFRRVEETFLKILADN